ncbi:hypothetical protein [Qipengyuania marisflavi]|uniref:Uncharacterized protein n=1 Tax=Qipengyuania marisflavi TaxID=2486356 RepID=A0A5S3P330_9SPHN|nr:hypothetical protein [Qipengyuania marisflavi]TMM47198.1 hypothetical protein FEV51_10470 [Qipengyuania marisflavi]
MFTQLTVPLPVHVIDKGAGLAFAMIDYGPEHNLIWVTALDDSGEIWCAPNPKVRMQANWTTGRVKRDRIETEVEPQGDDS